MAINNKKTLSNLSVLYVEDEEDFRNSISYFFSLIFEHIEIAIDGDDGIYKYNNFYKKTNNYFDIVITDILMPSKNGYDMSKEIKSINKEQIIIVTSAHTDSLQISDFMKIGVKTFFKKPFNIDSIKESLQALLNRDKSYIKLKDGYIWEFNNKILKKDSKIINLALTEYTILDILFNSIGQVFSVEDMHILTKIYLNNDENNTKISINSIRSIIKRLRKKIPKGLIKTVYGKGYKISLKNI